MTAVSSADIRSRTMKRHSARLCFRTQSWLSSGRCASPERPLVCLAFKTETGGFKVCGVALDSDESDSPPHADYSGRAAAHVGVAHGHSFRHLHLIQTPRHERDWFLVWV